MFSNSMTNSSQFVPPWTSYSTFDVNSSGWLDGYNLSSTAELPNPPAGISSSDLRMEQLQYMVRHLQIYLAPCVATIGLICNVLCVLALSCRPMLHFSTTHYIIAILVCDALQLAGVIQSWLNEFGLHLFSLGGWCQFSTFATAVVRFSSSWCLTALGLDRFLCVRYPSVEARFCLPWVARVIIIAIVIVATVVHLNISLLYAVIYVGEHAVCHVLLAYAQTMERLGYADVFVNSLVPSLLISSFALVILCQLLYNKHLEANPSRIPNYASYTRYRRRSLYAVRPSVTPEEVADLSQERLALALLFVFVAFALPYHAFRILDAVRCLDRAPTLVERLRSYLVRQILLHIRYVQLALDTAVIASCHKLVRRRFVERYMCGRCPSRDIADQEMGYTHRISFDEMSNDDSTIHIIRHEIQRSTATAV
ncbi:hypothetical protein LSH36_548g05024 [Paralvinella palmiformis]|uniref:G-protein coupled receptors family 1 profile domain-containing protein n=1 Tax=Paralvinella palmiformis TaxID=53620 RepID=A0AAD9J6V3_9ANNE|nr:hypothetical protein LSH36_548g05024 [Paralvinella palmiformis]